MTILTDEVRTSPEPAGDGDEVRAAGPVQAGHDVERWAGLLQMVQELETQVATLTTAVTSNRRIGIAVGIVMVQLTVDTAVAFEAIRQVSMNTNRKLHDVAEHVIREGGLRP